MNNQSKIYPYKTLSNLVTRLRDDLNIYLFVLIYAYNGTGKTRLSIEFKNKGKNEKMGDTLYFNAFTEDLFHWDNDLENDLERTLKMNVDSKFFNGFKELSLEEKIFAYLERYAEFDFKFDYESWNVIFSKKIPNPEYKLDTEKPEYIIQDNIKISRGEENIFIWCIFLAICELVIDGAESYNWVKYIYIDDPISSLDDNNAIAVASDLSQLLKKGKDRAKFIISSHHSLFFNVVCNELKKHACKRYFLHRNGNEGYTLQATDETPFFHHVALLSELQRVMNSGEISTYHFNILRSVLEKTSTFFGYDDFSKCIHGIEDEVLYSRALNLLSHGKYSIYEPVEMGEDNKKLFKNILRAFLNKYQFELPILLVEEKKVSINSNGDVEKTIIEKESEFEEKEIEQRISSEKLERIDPSQFEKSKKKKNTRRNN
ncbi:AAA family ATPase [Butyricimonas hominis]|uniref:AAA family ATPase n=1 Tax=Butyricimonas hominis TaxID=2763032 RepID=A0ABR7D348_9BACT|nr:AAA family ATPase [Butyricimonas hominis]MBC5622368.1 AAA family ATPase [Butyricimonas hominis]